MVSGLFLSLSSQLHINGRQKGAISGSRDISLWRAALIKKITPSSEWTDNETCCYVVVHFLGPAMTSLPSWFTAHARCCHVTHDSFVIGRHGDLVTRGAGYCPRQLANDEQPVVIIINLFVYCNRQILTSASPPTSGSIYTIFHSSFIHSVRSIASLECVRLFQRKC